MRFYITIILLIILSCAGYAQIAPSKYWIQFTDKDNTPYSINNPAEFLSQRAIDRRVRQGISISENDLPVDPAYVDSIKNTGVIIFNTSKWFNSVTIQTTDSLILEKILAFPFVVKLENIGKVSNKGSDNKMEKTFEVPDDYSNDQFSNKSLFDSKSPYNSSTTINYGPSLIQIGMLGGTILHEQGYHGDGLIIAVLDAGFWKVDEHDIFDSLWLNNRILGTKDFVNPGGNVFKEHSHGMSVLSIMGGNKPGSLVGVAPHAKYWLLRSEDTGSEYLIEEYNWVSAAEFADSAGVDIINSSLGYSVFWNSSQDHTYQDMDGKTTPSTIGADIAVSKGILVVNSAGNQGAGSWKYITAPSDGFEVLCIGAVDNEENYASFSSKGPSYDGRIKPNVSAMGEGAFIVSSGGNIVNGNGTSFSSPLIAGMSACLWQCKPDASVYEIIDAIEKSSSLYSDPDTLLGYGVPDFALAKIILSNPEINDFESNNSLDVFPNPFYDNLFVFFYSSGTYKVQFEIFDISGKKVYFDENIIRKPGYNLYTINMAKYLPQGVYVLKMISNGIVAEEKIIKLNR